jgi:Tfp pilus assembly protein PilF/peroxiredoxin
MSGEWLRARTELSQMLKEGRSFSGHERNCCFLNTGGGRFATVSAVTGLDFPDDARALVAADWDEDGDLDLWISNRNAPRLRFMRNESPVGNRHLALRLLGDGIKTNRDAIGARIEVFASPEGTGPRRVKTLRAGEGFLAQSTKWVYFGLGDADRVDRVVVSWPGGIAESFAAIESNGRYLLEQGTGQARSIPVSARSLAIAPGPLELPEPSRVARIPLVTLVPMPSLEFVAFDGRRHTADFRAGRTVLVNLWASWCRPCLAELKELSAHAQALQQAGIEVLALSVDGVGDDGSSPEAAARTLARMKFPFSAGQATDSAIDLLQRCHNDLILLRRPLPIPSSFLVNSDGRIQCIYKGPVSVETVLDDSRRQFSEHSDRWRQAALLPGRTVDHPTIHKVALQGTMRTLYGSAAALQQDGRLADAAKTFRALLEHDAQCVEAHAALGQIETTLGNFEQALVHLRQILSINPHDPLAHNSMGLIAASRGDTTAALAHYQQAIEVAPGLAEVHNNLGSLLASQGRYGGARDAFERAIELDKEFADAETNLGGVFVALGDLGKAALHYENAIRIDPNHAEAFNNLGSILARQGKYDEAIGYYDKALKINPQYAEARKNRDRAKSVAAKK